MAVELERGPLREIPRSWVAAGLMAAFLLGAAIGAVPLLAFLAIAIASVVIAVVALDRLAILVFWTLPYMVANLPTGSFTLKVPEVVGYLFATAFLARSLIRRERIVLPPATLQLIAYLAALVLAALFAPPVPSPYLGGVMAYDRNSPAFRPMSIVIWIGLSWLLVIALYNVVGSRPKLLWKCVRAHVLSGGGAAIVSLTIYVLALRGVNLVNTASGGLGRSLVTESGEGFRLAGVAYEPLFLAFYLQTVIPITAVALLAYSNWIPRWISGLCLGAQLMAMMLTVSAGGWMGALVGLLLLWPARLGRRLSRKAQLGLFAGFASVISLIVFVAIAQKDFSRIASGAAGKILSGGDRVRAGEWEAGMRMFEARPLTGMGPG
jgi:O-antigen ligase